ncbi:TPA: hypothetical protein R6D69_001869 [Campylobacter coli]|nr:hypothetical protein [Campylobacter coli]HED8367002.1 hypothetical protein [Campylobacter coli]
MQKQYPEVYSLEESLAILKKYKDDLTKEQYENIKSNIGTHAIESIYLNELDIIMLVKKNVYNKQINLIYFKEYNLYKLLKFYFKSK